MDRRAQVRELWRKGLPAGDPTGWKSIDPLYSVVPGQVTVITGWPGSGKSEWLDALLANLAIEQGWRFAIYSPENLPLELHIAKMAEKVRGKPFGQGLAERIAEAELDLVLDQLSRSFSFMDSASGAPAVQDIITAAAPHLGDQGKRGLVIDPWNELEHWRPPGMSETDYISLTLSTVRNWARVTAIHVWIVAHPQKVARNKDGTLPIPKPDMISGSAHWWNKSDACITVWRDMLPSAVLPNDVTIYVTKIRFKHVGRVGEALLHYDRVTGQYFEKDDPRARGICYPR